MNANTPSSSSIPEKRELRLGYMRLTDAAPLIMAKELGLYEDFGLDVELVREVSWANMRDRLAIGEFDAAHMLAPMPLTASLGIGGFPVPMLTGLGLGLNGNAICLSLPLFESLSHSLPDNWIENPVDCARVLGERLKWRQERQLPPLVLATVHPFSMHTLLLRHWLSAGGVNPDEYLRLVVLPPEQMADQLERGLIDGFCAGAPWPTRAVKQCQAVWIATGYHIWNNAPEKVLAVTKQWHTQHEQTHSLLRQALMKAGEWLDKKENRSVAAEMLSRTKYLDLPEQTLSSVLKGELLYSPWTDPYNLPDYHVFHRNACGYPWPDHARWVLNQVSRFVRESISPEECEATQAEVYRPDLYRDSALALGWPVTNGIARPNEGLATEPSLHDGISYGPMKRL